MTCYAVTRTPNTFAEKYLQEDLAMRRIVLGSVPVRELPSPLHVSDYVGRAMQESCIFLGQIRRIFGPEPGGVKFLISDARNTHYGGISVVLVLENSKESVLDYAAKVEKALPKYWDQVAKDELSTLNAGAQSPASQG
jgi:hypothetical protein